jgi:hypothetical protein
LQPLAAIVLHESSRALRYTGFNGDRRDIVLQLYFWPMACSLASRIALMEAGVEATLSRGAFVGQENHRRRR